MNLGLEIQKTNVGIKISTLEMQCVLIFRQNVHFLLFLPKFVQKSILVLEFQKFKSGFGISTSMIPCMPYFSQNGFLEVFKEPLWLSYIFWI